MAAVVRRGAEIGHWLNVVPQRGDGFSDHGCGRLAAFEHGFSGDNAAGDPTHAHHSNPHIARRAVRAFDKHRDGCQRIITVPAGELGKAPAGARRRLGNIDRGNHFRGIERVGERTGKEIGCCNLALPIGACDAHNAVQQQSQHGHFGGRIGMADAAAESAAIAHGEVGNVLHRGMEHGDIACDDSIAGSHPVAHERTKAQVFAPVLDAVEPGNTVDIDQHGGAYQPKVDHRHQALPARNDLAVAACRRERRHGVLHAFGPDIVERRRLHVMRP